MIFSGHLLYAFMKIIGYSLWCGVGIKYLTLSPKVPIGRSLALGLFRALIGAVLGILIGINTDLLPVSALHDGEFPMYFLVYSPIRIFEWSLILFLFKTPSTIPFKTKSLWIIGGIFVSVFIDILFAPDGLKIGRIFC